MAMRIRAAERRDVASMVALVAELALYERAPESACATEEQFLEVFFGASPRVYCDVAEWDDGGVVGFAVWFLNYSTWTGTHGIYLEDLFVQPGYRGRGIGTALLGGLARRCVERGYQRLEWSVLDWNRPAIEFYAVLGAEAMDEWTVHRVSGRALADLADVGWAGPRTPTAQ